MESLEKEVDYSFNTGLVMYTAGFTSPPLEGQPLPSEMLKFGSDSKGLFGNGGLFSSGVSSKSLVDVDPYKPTKGFSDMCKGFSSISSHSISSPTISLKKSKWDNPSWKMFSSDGGAPLIRIDCNAHHGKSENHLQYGKNFYCDRHGDEAFDIFGDVFTKSKKMKMF